MKKKVRKSQRGLSEILRILSFLDDNDMNVSLTAREMGVARGSVVSYHKKHWDEYQLNKSDIKKKKQEITLDRMQMSQDLEAIRNRVGKSFLSAMDIMDERMANPEEGDKVNNNQLIAHMTNLIPYLVEKQAMMGVVDVNKDNPMNNYTTFIQTFVSEMKINPPEKK